jgi:hypothetical protein
MTLAQRMKTQFIRDLCGIHCVWKILFIGKYQQDGIPQFVFVQHAVQLVPRLADAITIVAIDHENEALGVLEIMPPEGTDLQIFKIRVVWCFVCFNSCRRVQVHDEAMEVRIAFNDAATTAWRGGGRLNG